MKRTFFKKSEREKESPDLFGDPDNRLFPARDKSEFQESLALASRMGESGRGIVERLSGIAREKGFLPAAFSDEERLAERSALDASVIRAEAVAFERGEDAREEGDYVVYPGRKLFPAGWYESHQFGKTPEELALAPFAFSQVPLDLEHKTTVIKEEYTGFVANYSGSWEGDDYVMRGDVHVHKFLDPLLKDESKMSTTWSRETGDLTGVALLLNPRIPDAKLKSAFSEARVEFAKKHETYSGQSAIQAMHDTAARSGAICAPPKGDGKKAGFVSKGESSAIQAIHDAAVAAGAKCEAKGDYSAYYYSDDSAGRAPHAEEEKSMETTAVKATVPSASGGGEAAFAELEAKFQAERKRTDELAAKLRRADARAFAARFKEKITPRETEIVAAFAERLMEDDAESEAAIQFSDKESGSRLETLDALLDGLKPHRFSEEVLETGDAGRFALFEGAAEDGKTPEDSLRTRIAGAAKRYMGASVKKASE